MGEQVEAEYPVLEGGGYIAEADSGHPLTICTYNKDQHSLRPNTALSSIAAIHML